MNATRKWLALCLAILLALSGSAAMAQEAEAEAKAQWTVLLYLCGTDLEANASMATYNLQEIAKTVPSESVNFVIETGGAKEWHAEESVGLAIATDKLQRYQYDANGFTLVDEQPLDNMAAAHTLTDFVSWGAKAYPADKYLLVLWDHGGGSLGGLVSDQLHNGAIMPLEQLEIALADAKVPLEAIALDTCLMASLETAQAVKGSAKYLIASEEIVPGQGSAYEQWVQYLYDTPSCDGARLGRVFCDAAQQKYAELGMTTSSRQLTFSVIDLSKIDAVEQAFDGMFLEVGKLLDNPEEFYAFGYFTQHMQHFYYNTMVDLADMASRARNKAISNEAATAVVEAVDAAVVYNIKGDQRSYSHGLSFYYEPTASSGSLDHYARSCKSAPYLAFLDAVSMGWTAPAWVYEQTPRLKDVSRENYIVETALSVSPDGLPQLNVTNAKSAAVKVDTVLYQYEKASDTWLALGESEDVKGDFESGTFTAEFPASWITLNGYFSRMTIVEEMDTHALYEIPFQLVLPEMGVFPMQFRLAYIYDTPLTAEALAAAQEPAEGEEAVDPMAGHFEFYGVWDRDNADSTALPSRNSQELSSYVGYPIQLVLPRITLPDHYDAGETLSKVFTLTNDLSIGAKPLPKGDYAMVFKVTDVFGNTQMTDPVYVSWTGKAAVYSGIETYPEEMAQ